jgi:hypothetical protein
LTSHDVSLLTIILDKILFVHTWSSKLCSISSTKLPRILLCVCDRLTHTKLSHLHRGIFYCSLISPVHIFTFMPILVASSMVMSK